MKKIIGALALGAMVVGIATAEMSVSLNYRNGIDVFKYVNTGVDGRALDDYGNVYDDSGYKESGATYNLFNLTGWNGGKDTLSLKASGDVLNFTLGLQPSIGKDNDIVFHIMRIGAEVGNFFFNMGWTGDGIMNYRVPRDGNNGNEEGKVWETYKLGSAWASSDAIAANNQVSFGTGWNFFAYAGYSFVINDKSNVKLQAGLISDRKWSDPSTATWNDNLGWSVFISPKVKKVFDAEIFAKGYKNAADKQTLIFGAYGKPLVTPLIADAGIGGSVRLFDGNLMEYNFDVRLLFEINENFTITSMNKFAKLVSNEDTGYAKCDGDTVSALAGLNAFSSSQILWNMLGLRYKLNKTFTAIGAIGQITDLDSGFNQGRDSGDGTQLYFHPHVQIYANPKISVCAGALLAFAGIGADDGANKDVDVLVNIPVLIRIKM